MRVALRDIAAAGKETSPKQALLDALGDLSWYEPALNLVLIATYIRPEKIGSIIRPDKSMAEDRFQGIAGLIVRLGPGAFVNDQYINFGPHARDMPGAYKIGDWIVYRGSDATEQFVRKRNDDGTHTINDGVSCRLIEDRFVKGRISDPSLIY